VSTGRFDDPEAFREQVRTWLARVPRPAGLRDYGPTPTLADVPTGRRWQRVLMDHGYACLHWPVEYGGAGAPAAFQAVFAEECARAGVPRQVNIVGPDLAGPVVMRFGTARQRERYLPGIRSGEHLWCQLFSEPEAGSDLASVRTRAVEDGDGWCIDGQKVWTSAAAGADFGLLLARTGGPGHAGLSAFVVPMRTRGVVVRPLVQMDRESRFNEVFLTSVFLDGAALLGPVGGGWAVATATLGQERLALGANAVGMFAALESIRTAARQRGLLDAGFADRLVQLWSRVTLLRATWYRAVSETTDPSSSTFSVLKLLSSEAYYDIGQLASDALGLDGLADPLDEPLVHLMLTAHGQTILGGTSEIQRNILAERILGLPRERS
jgi:alkylation response protein AidB-like acyl-CoA dehydrogenase